MGYFSNGSEGMDYQEAYCSRCVHDINEDCPIWAMHLLFSYQLCNAKGDPGKTIIDELIPLDSEDLCNKQCTMFIARPVVADLFEGSPE